MTAYRGRWFPGGGPFLCAFGCGGGAGPALLEQVGWAVSDPPLVCFLPVLGPWSLRSRIHGQPARLPALAETALQALHARRAGLHPLAAVFRCIAGCCYCWGAGVLYRERSAMRRKQLNVTLSPEQYAAVQEAAAEEGVKRWRPTAGRLSWPGRCRSRSSPTWPRCRSGCCTS